MLRHLLVFSATLGLLFVQTAAQEVRADAKPPQGSPAHGQARKACAPTDQDYPIASRRAAEQGTTRLGFKVSPSGELASVTVIKSSGFVRLDEAAIKVLRTCALPTRKDASGNPVEASYSVEFTWRIE
jgi:periplasmic protein TonB